MASGRHDFSPANLIVNTLVSWNDPRLPFLYKQYNGGYLGGVPGAGNGYVKFSQFADQWLSPTWPADLLDYSETEFLLAEAAERGFAVTGTAESHYNNGITASIIFWGGDTAAATAYLAQPAVAYTTAAELGNKRSATSSGSPMPIGDGMLGLRYDDSAFPISMP